RPSYPAALVDFLARLAPETRLAWDAGCGSGQLSVLLAGPFDRVVATDASAEQIARAAPHPKVEYRCAPAGVSGLPARVVDLATATSGPGPPCGRSSRRKGLARSLRSAALWQASGGQRRSVRSAGRWRCGSVACERILRADPSRLRRSGRQARSLCEKRKGSNHTPFFFYRSRPALSS